LSNKLSYERFSETIDFMGGLLGEKAHQGIKMSIFMPKAYLWSGWENKVIIVISELLDNAIYYTFKISKCSLCSHLL
jgi:hypothetical protein